MRCLVGGIWRCGAEIEEASMNYLNAVGEMEI